MSVVFERKVDELGRIVIPLDLRRLIGLKSGDTINITLGDGKIVIEKKPETKNTL